MGRYLGDDETLASIGITPAGLVIGHTLYQHSFAVRLPGGRGPPGQGPGQAAGGGDSGDADGAAREAPRHFPPPGMVRVRGLLVIDALMLFEGTFYHLQRRERKGWERDKVLARLGSFRCTRAIFIQTLFLARIQALGGIPQRLRSYLSLLLPAGWDFSYGLN